MANGVSLSNRRAWKSDEVVKARIFCELRADFRNLLENLRVVDVKLVGSDSNHRAFHGIWLACGSMFLFGAIDSESLTEYLVKSFDLEQFHSIVVEVPIPLIPLSAIKRCFMARSCLRIRTMASRWQPVVDQDNVTTDEG